MISISDRSPSPVLDQLLFNLPAEGGKGVSRYRYPRYRGHLNLKKLNKSKHASIKCIVKCILLACQLPLCSTCLCGDAPPTPYPSVILSSKENVKLTKVRSDFKRFLLEKGKKRISHLVLLFLTNTWKAIDSLLFTNELSVLDTRCSFDCSVLKYVYTLSSPPVLIRVEPGLSLFHPAKISY